ncbi:MAG: 23S rRNA (guanosine(2251)-2'-O)-methyltransferase RlmB [Treponema sp.]|nr:23S rRNA (guanosine(2251)-2'-O)-methyltransferase RlmB [Treponema sp.]
MIITGFHSIEEKIRSLLKTKGESAAYKLYYSKPGPRVKKILAAAKEASVTAEQTDDKKLDELVKDLEPTLQDHRGIVMTIAGQKKPAENLVDFDAWIKKHSAGADDGAPARETVLILDKITDPHNVGAIIRSCDQFGASLVIIPEHNSASNIASNEIIGRSSAGASAWVPVAIVKNLVRATEQLKQAGFWIYGADAGGQNITSLSFAQKSAIIMGSEGSGIDSLLQKNCDTIVSIPTCGKIDSLNVSVAAGVLLYEVYRSITIQEK